MTFSKWLWHRHLNNDPFYPVTRSSELVIWLYSIIGIRSSPVCCLSGKLRSDWASCRQMTAPMKRLHLFNPNLLNNLPQVAVKDFRQNFDCLATWKTRCISGHWLRQRTKFITLTHIRWDVIVTPRECEIFRHSKHALHVVTDELRLMRPDADEARGQSINWGGSLARYSGILTVSQAAAPALIGVAFVKRCKMLVGRR